MTSEPLFAPAVPAQSLAQIMEGLGYGSYVAGSAHLALRPEELLISGVSVDNRDMAKGWAFVAIPGLKRHGAQFAAAAKANGAALLITDEVGASLGAQAGLPTLVVDDPRRTAGEVSSLLYAQAHENLVKIGVTGTNGKTTTAYFVRAAISSKFPQSALFGTIEVDCGKTRSYVLRTTQESPVIHRAMALGAEEGSTAAVVEVSSHALSLARVQSLSFDLAVFTNLQHDHLDFYNDSMDEYFEAKALLFNPEQSKAGVIAVDDQYTRRLAKRAPIPVVAVQVLTSDVPDIGTVPLWKATRIQPDASVGGSTFLLTSPSGDTFPAICPLPGLANVQDAAIAVVAAVEVGVPVEEAITALANAPSVPGRMHWIRTEEKTGPKVMVDYAHTPEAVTLMLDALRPVTPGKLVAVFGTDGDRDHTKREELAQNYADNADVLWVTDENPRSEDPSGIRAQLLAGIRTHRPDMHDVFEVTTSRRDAIREAILNSGPGDLVVIAGKGAERVQEIRGIMHAFYDPDVAAEVVRDAQWDTSN